MRITKTIATQVAKSILEKKDKEIGKLQEKLKQVFTDAHLKTIPKVVIDAFEKYPNWLDTSKSCRIKNEGFGWDYYYFTKSVPCVENWTEIDAAAAKEVSKLSNTISDLKKEYSKLKTDLEEALFALRTYKNITEQLPEAVPHLPQLSSSAAIMVDLATIRKAIA